MLYREIIAVCSEIHTKHINTLCGQNVELLNVKLVVHIVTTGLWRVNIHYTAWATAQQNLKTKINLNYTNIQLSVTKTSQLMLYKEIIAVCSQIHTKHINILCGQNVEFLDAAAQSWQTPTSVVMSIRPPVRPSASISAAPTEQNYRKFHIGNFTWKSVVKSNKNCCPFTRTPKRILLAATYATQQ